jgi:hypothetical protein
VGDVPASDKPGLTMTRSALLSDIETKLDKLSHEEQVWLIERLYERVRQGESAEKPGFEADLARMAADPEIQNELRNINGEFLTTEADGLENL